MTEAINPHTVLGVALDANAEQVRAAYLALVREFPPDRAPERFREIHSSYQMLSDPLVQAEALLRPNREHPNLNEIIAQAEATTYRFPKLVLLGLGNS
jgi:hypothetical protein